MTVDARVQNDKNDHKINTKRLYSLFGMCGRYDY